jgi:hypothetical protein
MRVKLPPLYPLQNQIRLSDARFKVLACGRRWGKTQLCAVLALATALGGGVVWWVAPTTEITRRGWEKIEPLARKIPGHRIRYADREIHLPGGGWIAFRSADGSSLRGPGIDLLILDEAAFIPANTWRAELRPTLSDRRGGAVFISTPDGRNWFYDMYQRGQDVAWSSWASWQMPSWTNPFIHSAEIEEARRDTPEWYFRQEYGAEFVTFAGKVYKTFTPECEAVFDEVDPGRYGEWWGGIDFGFRNPTAVSVGGIDRDDRLDIVDGLYAREMTNPDLIDAMRRLQEQYPVQTWFADPADPGTIQELRAAGLPVSPAPRTKGGLERSSVKEGIVKVETRLVAGRLRIARHLTDHVREMDTYRYAGEREGSEVKEAPLKVDDHAPDSIRYMVAGIDHSRGRNPIILVAA